MPGSAPHQPSRRRAARYRMVTRPAMPGADAPRAGTVVGLDLQIWLRAQLCQRQLGSGRQTDLPVAAEFLETWSQSMIREAHQENAWGVSEGSSCTTGVGATRGSPWGVLP